MIWSGNTSAYAIWENEIFNRSLRRFYFLHSQLAGDLPETKVTVDPETGLMTAHGTPVLSRWAVTDSSVELEGREVAQDPRTGMTLLRDQGAAAAGLDRHRPLPGGHVVGQVRLVHAARLQGRRADGRAPERPGALQEAADRSSPASAGSRWRCAQIPAGAARDFVVPLPSDDPVCNVDFEVSPTAVPAVVTKGFNQDTRELGLALLAVRSTRPPSARRLRRRAALPSADRRRQLRARLARAGWSRRAPTWCRSRRRPRPGGGDPRGARGLAVEPRLRFLPFAHFWRQGWSRLGWPPVERFLGPVDVLHFSDWMYPPQSGGLRSTMVHDLVPERFPDWVQGRTRRMHGAKYRNAARTCDVVFVNAEFTKGEVVELMGVPEEKVVVAYPGVGRALPAPTGERADLGRPYVLTVATLEPRKNLETLLAARLPEATRSRSSAPKGWARSRRSTGPT